MEWKIVVEAFQSIFDKYGLKILTYVGDGDSTTFKKIQILIEWGERVKKIEDLIHLMRAYRSSLEETKKKYKVKGGLNDQTVSFLCKMSRIMINKYLIQEISLEKLRQLIFSVPFHIYDIHSKCIDKEICQNCLKYKSQLQSS